MGVSQLKTGPESELVLLPENSRTEVGEGWGARPGGWGAFGTIERTWAGFVSWLCLTAPSSCLPSFGMFAGRSDAFGDTCSGCTVRRGLCVSDPELAGGEHTLLTEVVKPAKKKPAEAASPTASACAAFTANQPIVAARGGYVFMCLPQGGSWVTFHCVPRAWCRRWPTAYP